MPPSALLALLALLALGAPRRAAAQSCAAGTFGSSGCSPCPAGTYAAANALACTACPTGITTTNSATGQASVSACTICAPGYAGSVVSPGTTSAAGCAPCASGSSAAAGSSTCSQCLAGTFSTKVTLAWGAGNLIAVEVGDGTMAGAVYGANANSTVPMTLSEFFYDAALPSPSLVYTGAGQSRALPSTGAAAVTALGSGADQGGSRPFSGALSTSSNGAYLVVAGYSASAGSFVGASSYFGPINPPNASVSRVVSYVDAWGTASLVTGMAASLYPVMNVPQALPIYSAYYFAPGATQGGFYVFGGYDILTPGFGGCWWVPMSGGIGGAAGTAALVQIVPSGGSSTSQRLWSSGTFWNNNLYIARVQSVAPAGIYSFVAPNSAPTVTTAVVSGPIGPVTVTSRSNFDPRAIVFVGSPTAPAMFVADGAVGIFVYPSCSGSPIAVNGCSSTGAFATPLPGLAATTAFIVGAAAYSMAGKAYIAVTRLDGMWLWPQNNTGPFVSAVGTCCSNTLTGACCWGNNNSAVVAPRANYAFRGLALAPFVAPPSLCSSCPAGKYALDGAASCTSCAAGTASSAIGATSPATCAPCATGFYAIAGAATCTSCPIGISTVGSQTGSAAVTACAICAPGFAGAVTGSGTLAAAGCAACVAGTFSLAGASTCTPCAAGFYSGTGASACTPCSTGTYSFGGVAKCAVCPIGAAFVSASAGCKPSTSAWPGPYDTAFALSGTQAEGLVAFASVTAPLGVTYASSVFNAGPYNGALTLAAGSYVNAPGASAPPTLPTGNSPWTASAWVKCAAPTTYAAVLEWGAPGDANGVLSTSSIVLAVEGAYQWNISALANKGIATTLAGSVPMATLAGSGNLATGPLGWADGVGTNAGMQSPVDVHMDQSTGTLIVVQGTQTGGFWLIRRIGLDGTVTTIAGSPTLDCINPPTWNMSDNPQPPNRPHFIDGVGTNASAPTPTHTRLFAARLRAHTR